MRERAGTCDMNPTHPITQSDQGAERKGIGDVAISFTGGSGTGRDTRMRIPKPMSGKMEKITGK